MSSLALGGRAPTSWIVKGIVSSIEGSCYFVFLHMFSEFHTSSWREHVSPHCEHFMSFALTLLHVDLFHAQAIL